MSKESFAMGEFYHVYNHGIEDRDIVSDEYDSSRFLESLKMFNSETPIGSIYEQSFNHVQSLGRPTSKSQLVNIIAYCINPNHFHLLLEQVAENGISEFMKRLGGGYTKYYNQRNKRHGHLFRGKFKAVWVNSNEYLLHLSAYINLNFRVHGINDQLGRPTSKLIKSSWEEYTGTTKEPMCEKDIILGQFNNKEEYKEYAEDALPIMLDRKKTEREEKYLMIE
ncbi:MAG: transposase [Candidatus Paceibacterota bacterium]